MFDKNILPIIFEMNTTIMWIAVTVGILLYIIGNFAGGRLTRGRIILCTIVVTTIGVLSLRVPMLLYGIIVDQFEISITTQAKSQNSNQAQSGNSPPDTTNSSQASGNSSETPITFQFLTLLLYTVWIAFLIGMGIHFYETLIVTAEEIDKN